MLIFVATLTTATPTTQKRSAFIRVSFWSGLSLLSTDLSMVMFTVVLSGYALHLSLSFSLSLSLALSLLSLTLFLSLSLPHRSLSLSVSLAVSSSFSFSFSLFLSLHQSIYLSISYSPPVISFMYLSW